MKWQLLSGVLLLPPLVALGGPTELTSSGVVLPWPGVAGRPVLHVGHVSDLKSLLDAQAALAGVAEGHRIRLLGVSRDDAWFVTEDLSGKGWRDLLVREPRFRLVGPAAEAVSGVDPGAVAVVDTAPSVETVIWDPDAVRLPAITPAVSPPVQSPL